MPRRSRYEDTPSFSSTATAPGSGTDFPGLRPRPIGPATGVIEHEVRAGDRLDHLARHYYNDDRLWWRILDANPQLNSGLDLFPVMKQAADDEAESSEGDLDRPDLVGDTLLIPQAQEA